MRPLTELVAGRAGLRVIGDVQGYAEPFERLATEARERDLAILQLGDVIDRGPDSPGAMALMLKLVDSGEAIQIAGNHCDKFFRYRQGRQVEIKKSGLAMTLEQLAARRDGEALAQRYASLVSRAPLWLAVGRYFFVHGAFDPDMLRRRAPVVADRARERRLSSLALFGETDGTVMPDGKPRRTYRWIDRVPAALTVCIGHDVVSTSEVVVRHSAAGGRAVHLDLGPDRGGRIGYLDIEREALLA